MCLRKDAVLERLSSIVWILQDSFNIIATTKASKYTKINILLRPKSYDMSQWILRARVEPWSARWAKVLSKFNSDHNFGQCFAAVDLDQLCAVHGYRVCLSNVPGPSQKKRQDSRCQNQRVAVSITCLGPRYTSSGGLDGTLSSGYTFKTFGTLGHIRHSAAMIRGWKIALSGSARIYRFQMSSKDWLVAQP